MPTSTWANITQHTKIDSLRTSAELVDQKQNRQLSSSPTYQWRVRLRMRRMPGLNQVGIEEYGELTSL
jgi:hypothetical protein